MNEFIYVFVIFQVIVKPNLANFVEPCHNKKVSVFDFPNSDDSWNGIVHLHQQQKGRIVRVDLQLAANARVNIIDNDGQVTGNENIFHLVYPRPAQPRDKVRFHVKGLAKNFPYIVRFNVNGVNVCRNPIRWKHLNGQGGTRRTTRRPGHTTRRPGPTRPTRRPGPVPPKPVPTESGRGNDDYDIDPRMDRDPAIECGKRRVAHQGLITNGYPSKEGDWPWHVAIYHFDTQSSSSYKCGGTLISSDTVLTAAHCVSDGVGFLTPTRVLVKVGLHNRQLAGSNTREIPVFSIVPHVDFEVSDLRNDIAILKLGNKVTFNNYVLPACLWPQNEAGQENVINRNGLVVGWGLNEADTLQDILTQGEMPVVSFTDCLQSNRDFFGLFLTDKNYCAGFRNGTSVCNGDSGGGMFFNKNGVFHVRGIVSLSVARDDKDVCNPKQYVLFTDTAKFLSWIKEVAE